MIDNYSMLYEARFSLPEPKAKILPQFSKFFWNNFFKIFFYLYCITLQISFCIVRMTHFINFITFTFSLPRIAFCAKLRDNCIVWTKSCLLLFCHTVWVSSSDVGKISLFTSTYFSSVLLEALLQKKQNKPVVRLMFECVFLIWRGLQRVKTKKTRESISDWFRISRENFTVRGFSLVDLCCTVDSVGSSNTWSEKCERKSSLRVM